MSKLRFITANKGEYIKYNGDVKDNIGYYQVLSTSTNKPMICYEGLSMIDGKVRVLQAFDCTTIGEVKHRQMSNRAILILMKYGDRIALKEFVRRYKKIPNGFTRIEHNTRY